MIKLGVLGAAGRMGRRIIELASNDKDFEVMLALEKKVSIKVSKEITSKSKYYFLDNGLRNAVIANFNPFNMRDDVGKLWENFIFTEMIKSGSYKNRYANRYFWRTYDQKEIDYIEEREGKLFAYEFKWNDKAKQPKEFLEAYPNTEFKTINKENYLDFIL